MFPEGLLLFLSTDTPQVKGGCFHSVTAAGARDRRRGAVFTSKPNRKSKGGFGK